MVELDAFDKRKEECEIYRNKRISAISDPTHMRSEVYSDNYLIRKCKVWDSIENTMWNSLEDATLDSVKDKIWYWVDEKVSYSIRTSVLTIQSEIAGDYEPSNAMWNSLCNSEWDSIWHSVLNSVRPRIFSEKNRIIELVDKPAWNSIIYSMYIEAYTKFTSLEFYGILKPTLANIDKQQVMEFYKQFNELNWFWKNGLYCLKSKVRNEYYVCSYHDPLFVQKVTLQNDDDGNGTKDK